MCQRRALDAELLKAAEGPLMAQIGQSQTVLHDMATSVLVAAYAIYQPPQEGKTLSVQTSCRCLVQCLMIGEDSSTMSPETQIGDRPRCYDG